METIISVRDLDIKFNLRGQVLQAVRGVSLDIYKGESLAIVGESGSGKSVFVKSLMGLLDANGCISAGEILYEGRDLAKITKEKDWQSIRGREIAIVMQDPMTSLNPLHTVGAQVAEAVKLHQGLRGTAAKIAALEHLDDVGIPDPARRYNQYPHEFSGGMRQRACIAIALACKPKVLICDEPTTALDVTIQAQILDLIKELKRRHNLTTVYITHDLGVVAKVADRVLVMYAGDFVEMASVEELFYDPRHPYTWALLSGMPQFGVHGEDLHSIAGTPPNLFYPVAGDAVAPRNPNALKIDFVERPPFFDVTATHRVRSWSLDPRAPKIPVPDNILRLRKLGAER